MPSSFLLPSLQQLCVSTLSPDTSAPTTTRCSHVEVHARSTSCDCQSSGRRLHHLSSRRGVVLLMRPSCHQFLCCRCCACSPQHIPIHPPEYIPTSARSLVIHPALVKSRTHHPPTHPPSHPASRPKPPKKHRRTIQNVSRQDARNHAPLPQQKWTDRQIDRQTLIDKHDRRTNTRGERASERANKRANTDGGRR